MSTRPNTALLKELAGRMKEPAEYTNDFARDAKAAETGWIERKEKLERRCAVAFIGREPGEDTPWSFRYNNSNHRGGRMELAFLMPARYAPAFPDTDTEANENGWATARHWENSWAKRSNDLGLDGAFRYSDFSVGTHAPIEEQKLVLHASSDMDISNKMDALLDPDKLAKTQMYFNEVLSATLTKVWFDNYHPDFHSELQRAWRAVQGQGQGETAVAQRRKIWEDLEKQEKHVQWRAVMPALIEKYPTTGALIEAVHGPAPQGQQEIYKMLRQWSANTFPLLNQSIKDRTFAPARNFPKPTAG